MEDAVKLLEFFNYRWCPRTESDEIRQDGYTRHKHQFLIHTLTEYGYTCMDQELYEELRKHNDSVRRN